jgi:hypothetical protein
VALRLSVQSSGINRRSPRPPPRLLIGCHLPPYDAMPGAALCEQILAYLGILAAPDHVIDEVVMHVDENPNGEEEDQRFPG